MTIQHLNVKIKCKIEWRKDTLVAQGPRVATKTLKMNTVFIISSFTSPSGDPLLINMEDNIKHIVYK